MSTEEELERIAKPWKEVGDHLEAKAFLKETARVADVTIPSKALFVQYPEREEFHQHPLVAGFADLTVKNENVSHAPSRDGLLYKKHLNLQGGGLPRDKCFELRNLYLMDLDIQSFLIVQDAMQKILFDNVEQDENELSTAISDILNELAQTKKRYLKYNADNNQKEVDELVWLGDGVLEKFEPLKDPEGDHESALKEFKALLQQAYDKVYNITPRILTLKFFSVEKKIVGESARWNLVLVTSCLGRNLHTFLEQYRGRRGNTFFQRQALDIMIQMTECVTFLHENHYLHGDLKDDNYFVLAADPNNLNDIQIFLGDLGQSRLGDVTKTNYGFPPFKAPEFGSGRTKRTDIYALGLTLLQIVSPNEMNHWINRFNFAPPPNVSNGEKPTIFNMNRDLHDLIANCLAFKPSDRPAAFEVLRRLKEIRKTVDPNAIVPSEGRVMASLPGEYHPPQGLDEAIGGLKISEESESNYTTTFP